MTDSFLDYAEEQFLDNDFIAAYRTAKTAQQLDPFFKSIDRYVAAYRVHAASLCRHADGEVDWYNILGVDRSSSVEEITHRFCRLGKLINPDHHCSAAAKGAYELASKAFEILIDPEARASFHRRWRFGPLPSPHARPVKIPAKPNIQKNRECSKVSVVPRSCAVSSKSKRQGHTTLIGARM